MDSDTHWFVPDISLPKQLEREIDRRCAARMQRDELCILVDKLIVDWYRQNELVVRLLHQVHKLQIEAVLSGSAPSAAEPKQEHLDMAKEVLSELGYLPKTDD